MSGFTKLEFTLWPDLLLAGLTGGRFDQSSTQWPPLKSRIDLCQRLTVWQDSCKMHLCSNFCFLDAIFVLVFIFSRDKKRETLDDIYSAYQGGSLRMRLVKGGHRVGDWLRERSISSLFGKYELFNCACVLSRIPATGPNKITISPPRTTIFNQQTTVTLEINRNGKEITKNLQNIV